MSYGHIRVKFSILLSNHVFCYQLSLCTSCEMWYRKSALPRLGGGKLNEKMQKILFVKAVRLLTKREHLFK